METRIWWHFFKWWWPHLVPFSSMIFPAINLHLVWGVWIAIFDYQRVTTGDFPWLRLWGCHWIWRDHPRKWTGDEMGFQKANLNDANIKHWDIENRDGWVLVNWVVNGGVSSIFTTKINPGNRINRWWLGGVGPAGRRWYHIPGRVQRLGNHWHRQRWRCF